MRIERPRNPVRKANAAPYGLGRFLDSYIETALRESTDDDGQPLERNHDKRDIDARTLVQMRRDAGSFLRRNGDDIDDYRQAGNDFWLTRNGVGAGFWDGDWPEPAAKRLTDSAHAFGTFDLYVGDDGKIHGTPLVRRKPNASPMISEAEALARFDRMRTRRRFQGTFIERANRQAMSRGEDESFMGRKLQEKARAFELRNDHLDRLANLALQQARQGSSYPPGTMLDWYVTAQSPDGSQTVFVSGPHDTQDEANSLVRYHRSILTEWGSPYSRSAFDADFGIAPQPAGAAVPTVLVKGGSRGWDFPAAVEAERAAQRPRKRRKPNARRRVVGARTLGRSLHR